MILNHHELEKRFELLIEQIDHRNILNTKILELGKNDSLLVGNFVRLNTNDTKTYNSQENNKRLNVG